MSFRSIGALPICLHGRLASLRAIRSNCCAQTHRCIYSVAQAVSTVSEADVARRQLREPLNARYDLFDLRSKRRLAGAPNSNDEELRRQVLSSDSSCSTSSDVNPSPPTQISDRVGTELEVPDFIEAHSAEPAFSAVQPQEKPQWSGTGDLQQKLSAERYEEWEQLHDKFHQVWKSSPNQLSKTFLEQRTIAREFLGDIRDETSTQRFDSKWLALDAAGKKKILPSLLLGSLAESASQTIFVLSNIGPIPRSFYIRMNCLRYLAHLYWDNLRQDSQLKALYEGMIKSLRSPDTWPPRVLPTVLLQNLLFWSTPEQCQRILRDFSEKYPDSETSSVLAIIDHYLHIEDREQAFEHFRSLPADALRQPSEHIRSLRDRLLKLDFVERSDGGANFKYLPELLGLGIQPDENLYNIVIQNAISSEIPDVAWDLKQYMESRHFRPSARSHLVLLRDAFSRGDFKRVDEVMTSINNREDLVSDQYLMAYSMNIIRNISSYEKKLSPNEAKSQIMALYDRAYDRVPLVGLGIVALRENSPPLPKPSPTLLAFTIWTCVLVQHNEREVRTLWEWFKYLIANDDEAISQAARYEVIYNGFILFYVRHKRTLFRALDVIQYMLSSRLCLPTSRTWSILVYGYLKHEEVEQAKKVLALMQTYGYKIQEVQEATDKYGRYIPQGHNLEALAAEIDRGLDERKMPEAIDELLADSSSLR